MPLTELSRSCIAGLSRLRGTRRPHIFTKRPTFLRFPGSGSGWMRRMKGVLNLSSSDATASFASTMNISIIVCG